MTGRIRCGVFIFMNIQLSVNGNSCVLQWAVWRRADQKHPPLSLEEILPMPDASLDLSPPLSAGVADVPPSLQQQVRHEEHERPQLLILLHPHTYIHDTCEALTRTQTKVWRKRSLDFRFLLLRLLLLSCKVFAATWCPKTCNEQGKRTFSSYLPGLHIHFTNIKYILYNIFEHEYFYVTF